MFFFLKIFFPVDEVLQMEGETNSFKERGDELFKY